MNACFDTVGWPIGMDVIKATGSVENTVPGKVRLAPAVGNAIVPIVLKNGGTSRARDAAQGSTDERVTQLT